MGSCDSDSISEGGFPDVDFTNVEFDQTDNSRLVEKEKRVAFVRLDPFDEDDSCLRSLGQLLVSGQYIEVLSSQEGLLSVVKSIESSQSPSDLSMQESLLVWIREETRQNCLEKDIELELIGIAALNLFLQCNYTGPALTEESISNVYPTVNSNAILSELAVDGYWPCPVAQYPFFLLLSRTIFLFLTTEGDSTWLNPSPTTKPKIKALTISSVLVWSARAAVAHQRLLQGSESSITLWNEVDIVFDQASKRFLNEPSIYLERGLAEHYFDRPGKGRKWFEVARDKSGLEMEVTGAVGRRTKFQSNATAQMVVKAQSRQSETTTSMADSKSSEVVKDQLVEHSEEEILLERVKFEDELENEIRPLSILDQSVLLALCLDVKNTNPSDEALTNEEMGAFLARVLDHQDDWMVYSTALLERSWLEFGRSHARERSILQMQALADQHTNRLTITQSTRASVEESASVQDRLSNLHRIVYPPRWSMIEDLADRYASLGIVTSAAELYTEIELWDSVVECYQRAGREAVAETIVRERLALKETPRMWSALGDLTKDPTYYEKALELSNGRFSDAHIALGEYFFSQGKLTDACVHLENALKIRPLIPSAWFRLGTMSMQLENWQQALRSFSEVVMQTPDEADAWANIAAIHLRNEQPAEAYPALNESLKHRRSNWRVWVTKLYTCLDLQKFDEAIQACSVLLDLRNQKQASDGIPFLEEKCVKAIVGGALENLRACQGDQAAEDSSSRTLARILDLLDRMRSSADAKEEVWILETIDFIQSSTGKEAERCDTLFTKYQALISHPYWEKDDTLVTKICKVVADIADIQLGNRETKKEDLVKLRFMARGVVNRLDKSRPDDCKLPPILKRLRNVQSKIADALGNKAEK